MGRRRAARYTDKARLQSAVIAHCKMKWQELYDESWDDEMSAFTNCAGQYEVMFRRAQQGRRLIVRLVHLVDEIHAYTRDTNTSHHERLLNRATESAVDAMDDLVRDIDAVAADSARTFAVLGFVATAQAPTSIPIDKRRRKPASTRHAWNGTFRHLTDGEVALRTLLMGFFPNVRAEQPTSVAEVLRLEEKVIHQTRARLRKAARQAGVEPGF